MSNHGDEKSPEHAGGLWARLFGVESEETEKEPTGEPDKYDLPLARRVEPPQESPTVEPIEEDAAYESEVVPDDIPVAEPTMEVNPVFPNMSLDNAETATPIEEQPLFSNDITDPVDEAEMDIPVAKPIENPELDVPAQAVPETGTISCPACGTKAENPTFCMDCGYMFVGNETSAKSAGSSSAGTPSGSPQATTAATSHVPPPYPLLDRFRIEKLIMQRGKVFRYTGVDLQDPSGKPQPVIIVTNPISVAEGEILSAEPVDLLEASESDDLEDFLPSFDDPPPAGEIVSDVSWPGIAWEKSVLEEANHPSLPRVLDSFVEGEFEYLVLEQPQGTLFWDAWDDPSSDSTVQYGWLIELGEALHALHGAGAMLEGIRPDLVVVNADGRAVIRDLADLLPIPLPAETPIRGTLYTAPELMLNPGTADARADLYGFGAMIYALEYLHHDLEEKDFERQFYPKMITDRYPDVHPAFNRLIIKTFVRDLNMRFPTDEAAKEDPTGFTELIRTLQICQKTFARVRLDIAAWTTTGVVRTGNEDAFAFLHAVESRQDDLTEYGLALLCDGMGGYEAGEVAAAMAIQELRTFLLQKPMFSALSGQAVPNEADFSIEECKQHLMDALKHTNKAVYDASRTPSGKRGMGCTAEAVYIDDQHLVVGHVGDSRTYHLTNGRLVQLTRDQTWVNRMVELGQLTEEEAETHDRKNELQQAIGGAPVVEPGIYHAKLNRGDWILICSDGITNHIPTKDLENMLTRESASSAEDAARRLLNLVNLRGATDNATLVLIRTS